MFPNVGRLAAPVSREGGRAGRRGAFPACTVRPHTLTHTHPRTHTRARTRVPISSLAIEFRTAIDVLLWCRGAVHGALASHDSRRGGVVAGKRCALEGPPARLEAGAAIYSYSALTAYLQCTYSAVRYMFQVPYKGPPSKDAGPDVRRGGPPSSSSSRPATVNGQPHPAPAPAPPLQRPLCLACPAPSPSCQAPAEKAIMTQHAQSSRSSQRTLCRRRSQHWLASLPLTHVLRNPPPSPSCTHPARPLMPGLVQCYLDCPAYPTHQVPDPLRPPSHQQRPFAIGAGPASQRAGRGGGVHSVELPY